MWNYVNYVKDYVDDIHLGRTHYHTKAKFSDCFIIPSKYF